MAEKKPPFAEEPVARFLRDRVAREGEKAPGFSSLLARSDARFSRTRGSRARRTVRRLAAAAVVVVVVFWAVHSAHRAARRNVAVAVALERWQSPTDSLLATPGTNLLASVPVLADPVPDYSSLEREVHSKGDRS